MSVILQDNSLVHYEVLGRGRPVIFLHGWLGSWRYWISAMQVTSTSYRAYTVDLWGFGDTPHIPDKPYSIVRQTGLMANFFTEMGIGRIAMVGHGLGALVAMSYAMTFPDTVDRLMLISAPIEPGQINPRLVNDDLETLANWLLSDDPLYDPIRIDLKKQDPRTIPEFYASLMSRESFWEHFREIRTPTLFVHGENDPLIKPEPDFTFFNPTPLPGTSLTFESQMRYNFHQIVLEDAAHYPMLEQSARFNRLLSDFLALESGDSPRELQLKEEWKRRVR